MFYRRDALGENEGTRTRLCIYLLWDKAKSTDYAIILRGEAVHVSHFDLTPSLMDESVRKQTQSFVVYVQHYLVQFRSGRFVN